MPSLPDRPEVLTEDVQREIVLLIRQGNYFETSCIAAGTTKWTVEYWRKLVESGVEHAQKYADFFTALKKAVALAETDALSDIKRGVDSWQSRAWFLERRYPKRWGRTLIETDVEADKPEPRIKLHDNDARHQARISDGPPQEGDGIGVDP